MDPRPLITTLTLVLCVGCANPYAAPSCSDGVDNDHDGVADLADPDCGGEPNRDGERLGRGLDAAGIDAAGIDAAGIDAAGIDAALPDAGPPDAAGIDGALPDAGPPDAGGGCDPGPVLEGACAAQVRPEMCGGTCVDLNADAAHCGDCATDCGAGGVCIHGRCSGCAAIGGTDICGGRCTRPVLDAAICSRTCSGDGCDGTEICVPGPGASPPRCETSPNGDRCALPFAVAIGSQTLDLDAVAILDATRPRCIPADASTRSSLIVRFTPAASGTFHATLSGPPGHTLALQVLTDADCRCPAPEAAACAVGASPAVEAPVSAGTPLSLIVVSDTVDDQVTLDVSVD